MTDRFKYLKPHRLNSVPFKVWLIQFLDKFNQVISPKLINWSEFKLIWNNECEALQERPSALQGQIFCGLRADKINSPCFCPRKCIKGSTSHLFTKLNGFFSPTNSNRLVLSRPKGDILQIRFCEIISSLKDNEVGLFHKDDLRIKRSVFFRESVLEWCSDRSSKTWYGRFNNFEDNREEKDCVRLRYRLRIFFSQNLKITSSRKVKLHKNFSKAILFLK